MVATAALMRSVTGTIPCSFELTVAARIVNEAQLRHAVNCVISALRVLHVKGYVHRDVRWPNVLRDAGGGRLLIDFELADEQGLPLSAGAVRAEYLPPEHLQTDNGYTCAGDLYKVGRLLADWATQKNVILSPEAQLFCTALCVDAPEERLTADAALNHTWLKMSEVAPVLAMGQ